MFDSVLIANRGEIALRICYTARKLGLRTVAVYSKADATASHVAYADEAVEIGEAAPSASYLNIDAIIDAAVKTNCQAVHPGYGFLSENPEFADRCVAAGLTFIGPKSESLRAMGHKDAAKQRMIEAGVPVVPGYHGENQASSFLSEQAAQIGYPLLIKARAGGGGKGMRLVEQASEFEAALASAQRESASAFGDDHVLLEKYINKPRHIEVQVFGDQHGNVVHLYERDCSLQRRHQKVIEESPAPGISDEFREAVCAAAVTAASSISYEGAGTIEFIVDGSGALSKDDFWFMEMNTRLQVEHPVTEAVTGLDLVEWQFVVASGGALPRQQHEISTTGHAVEARLYAEDVPAGFLPATGTIGLLRWPSAGRVDGSVEQGSEILPFYDPMLAKLITSGETRSQAFANLAKMLNDTVMLGTVTNRDFLLALSTHPDVLSGDVSTTLIEEQLPLLLGAKSQTHAMAIAALALTVWPEQNAQSSAAGDSATIATTLGPWQLWGLAKRQYELLSPESELVSLQLLEQVDGSWLVTGDGFSHQLVIKSDANWVEGAEIDLDGKRLNVVLLREREFVDVHLGESTARVLLVPRHRQSGAGMAQEQLTAAMPGVITQIACSQGQVIEAGTPLLSLEAMKMEQTLEATHDAVIAEVCIKVGQQVAQGQVLVRFEFDDNSVNNAS